jgi:anti-sigma factor RsiW
MTEERRQIPPGDLHKLADGQLEPARATELQAGLAGGPDARAVDDYQRINAGLHALFDPVLAEPVPERLRRRPAARWSRSPWLRRATQAAAALLLLVVGAAGGWYARDTMVTTRQEQNAMVRPAVRAHNIYVAERRHPVEVRADEEHLVRWLSNRLRMPLKTPDLQPLGFKLMGGRLLPTERGVACQFMYEDAQGRRLTLYIRNDLPGNRETAFQFGQDEGGVGVFYWIDGSKGYAITGQMTREDLLGLARKVYDQLEG